MLDWVNPDTVYLAGVAVLLLVMLREWRRFPARFDGRDTRNNLLMYVGYLAVLAIWTPVLYAIYRFGWDHRLLDFGPWWMDPTSWQFWASWGALFLLEDFSFYWFHRCSHRIGFWWASHVTHHSSPYFNFSTALRQSWIPFHTFVFWLPLCFMGFDPLMVMTMQVISLAYQAFLHTTRAPLAPWFEAVFNTPTHHRVHHASNPQVIDRNFGGVLIVWDRLFGTFAEPCEDLRFGVNPRVARQDPLWLELHGWIDLLRSVRWRTPRKENAS